MDPLPPVPASKGINDTTSLIRNTFDEKLESELIPLDVANNLKTYSFDDNLGLKNTANKIVGIYRSLEESAEYVSYAEFDILKQHLDYIFAKDLTEKSEFLREMIKMKPQEIFADFSESNKVSYALIQKCDLYPDLTRQFLDFRFNTTLHQCKRCFPKLENARQRERTRQQIPKIEDIKKSEEKVQSWRLEPQQLFFKNFEVEKCYELTFKLKNVSAKIQQLSIYSHPKSSEFTLEIEGGLKLAPGMSTIGTIKFYPILYTNLKDSVSFRSRKGELVTLPILAHRDPPKLTALIQKSNDILNFDLESKLENNNFSFKRQRAVNNTIDCGSCLINEFVLVSITFVNTGTRGTFFWLPEDDYCYQDINSISMQLELTKDCFWIYPTYFEILPNRCCEINILFQPLQCGLHTYTFYIMCDNNTYRQIELIGDGVCFNKNMITIDIPGHTKKIEQQKDHRIFMGHLTYNQKSTFTLTIRNHSSICLKYALKLDILDEQFSMTQWIKNVNEIPDFLAPYSTTEVIFEVECQNGVPTGYYNAKLRLFIKDIPIASLADEDVFTVSKSFEDISIVDVLVMESIIACHADPQNLKEKQLEPTTKCATCGIINCACTVCEEIINPPADLVFNQPFLDLGILPIGVDVKKELYITNLGTEKVKWIIVELKYDIDTQPYVEIMKDNNLSSYHGTLHPHKKYLLTYKVEGKSPAPYVSVLVLFSVKENKNDLSLSQLVAQSICVVSYEITTINIVFKTHQTTEPILCPMQMLYTATPVNISFKIRNCSLIPGCFYFLKPTGSDADKINVEYFPQSGELNPGSSKTIRIELTCYDVGILENIYLPCFIGKGQDLLQLRLLCVVDCVHVFFYLPSRGDHFEKILWPSKVIYEPDLSWNNYCLCEEVPFPGFKINTILSEHSMEIIKRSEETLDNIKKNFSAITETDSDESGSQDILKTFLKEDPNIILQDCIMEVRKVITNEPKKITIYFENVTPKAAKYSVQSTNFPIILNNIKACLGPKYEKTENLWEPMIGNHGILVHPNVTSNYMEAYQFVSVDIWIYANTWGIYADEIIVDIENIASFSFTLIIEVVGCPLQLPSSIGAITRYPTIRLGSIAFGSEPITKDVLIRNTSSIDVTISWHVFYFNEECDSETTPFNFICDIAQKSEDKFEFNFTDRFFGNEGFSCVEVHPTKLELQHKKQMLLSITFSPNLESCFSEKCPIKCFILGRIFPKKSDKLRPNYFYRKDNLLIMEAIGTIEKPRLDVTIENESLTLYANDVVMYQRSNYYIRLVIKNPTLSQIKLMLDGSTIFSFININKKIVLEAGRCKEIYVPCLISYEKILKWADLVYQTMILDTPTASIDQSGSVQLVSSDKESVDDNNKILKLQKKLFLIYHGLEQIIPININIYYPKISVKPSHIKLGYILLGQTVKATVSIFNLTGCKVLFEIYKTISTDEIIVTPSYGEIEKSTGMNNSFSKITIYFTPTECRTYHESIRVATNIPQYYIDIPIKITGSTNEKFS